MISFPSDEPANDNNQSYYERYKDARCDDCHDSLSFRLFFVVRHVNGDSIRPKGYCLGRTVSIEGFEDKSVRSFIDTRCVDVYSGRVGIIDKRHKKKLGANFLAQIYCKIVFNMILGLHMWHSQDGQFTDLYLNCFWQEFLTDVEYAKYTDRAEKNPRQCEGIEQSNSSLQLQEQELHSLAKL